MKLNKAEIAAIVITLIFIALTVISSLWDSNGSATITVSAGSPTSTEASKLQTSPLQTPESSAQANVNINSATVQELCSLPAIGETLAKRIISYREEHGAFDSIDEVMSVEGIGAKTYEDIKSHITVD